MIACYDLARCPPTYDAVAFLAAVEVERLRRGADHVDIYVLPGPAGGFRRDSLWPHTVEERIHLRDRVLVPLCGLLPCARRMHVLSDRRDVAPSEFGVNRYGIGLPAIMRALRAGSRPLRSARAPLLREPDLVTFTLRESDHHQLRNSRTEEWLAAAEVLRARGLRVRIVRDTVMALDRLVNDCPSASAFVAERAALYARAALNVGICNGPMWMSIFMGVPALMLRPTTNAARGCYDDAFYAEHGLPRGAQLPTSPLHQRLVWQEDTRDNIVQAVEDMMGAVG